ncbi:hypothetical protein RRG08_024458 [Elysia crispata]|uniref:HMG box domain-containing protein n=1 Tax=Elysia crispata TaxID=231223 RepID=A0AAE0YPG3_9GAST|nr:hypothetical protein RRG08_024458 [Elysia crispata]
MDFSSDLFQDLMMGTSVSHTSAAELAQQVSFGSVEFDDLFPSNGKTLDASPQDLEVSLDSPVSLELHHDDMDMGMFRHTTGSSVSSLVDDNLNASSSTAMSPSFAEDDQSDVSSARADLSPSVSPAVDIMDDDEQIEHDRLLLAERMRPYEKFPTNNDWTLRQKLERLLGLSPCKKYTLEFLLQLDQIEDADRKVDILIELVSKIKLNFWWNYVRPEELNKAYTSASFCKKEKKKDSEGHVNPKRPMNAFMIWSKQCRSLISQICPQLHNATISKKLGVWWRKFSNEEKDVFEREKVVLTAFHAFEFPEYKYRPRKKATKKTEDKQETTPKEKPNRKRKSPSSKQNQPQQQQQEQDHHQQQLRQSPLKGINISEPRANLDPALQRKLQSKMNVKIDPGMRRDMSLSQGNRCTAINLADLTSLHSSDRSSSPGPSAKRLCLRPIEVQQAVAPTTIDLADTANRSTVFDTPGNSPHTPVTPVTPNESALGVVPSTSQGQPCFDFSLPSAHVPVLMEQIASTSNNNIIVSTSGNQFVFPVGPAYKAPQIPTGNIIAINNRMINESNNNNNIIINNNNALLNNNNITVKSEPLLFQGSNVIVKSEPLLLQNSAVTLRPEPLLLHTDNLALKQDALMMQGNATVKHEPVSPHWSLTVKTEADQFTPAIIKSEPEMTSGFSMPSTTGLDLDSIHQLPMLSADVVDEVLEAGITSYSNDNLLTDIMTFIGGSGQYDTLEGPATV